jgi:hypothetical protein
MKWALHLPEYGGDPVSVTILVDKWSRDQNYNFGSSCEAGGKYKGDVLTVEAIEN